MNKHITIFTDIYENCVWGNNYETEYNGTSGLGSEINYNKDYIFFLKKFIVKNNVSKITDLGCGDFKCGKSIYDNLENINYLGYDAYDKIVNNNNNLYDKNKYKFIHLDFYNERHKIEESELCIIKDVLQHWKLNEIYIFLDYLLNTKKFKYILICNCCDQKEDNTEIITGDFRPLSCNFFPLKRYKPIKLYNYNSKEISLIKNI
jgi:hypothetical protein